MQNQMALLNYFKDEIHKEANKELVSIQKETEEIQEKALISIEQEAKVIADQHYQKELEEISIANAKEIATIQGNSSKELIAQRNKYVNEIFDAAKEKLLEFVASDQYKPYLLNLIKKMNRELIEDGSVFTFSMHDQKYDKDIQKLFVTKVEIEYSQEIEIGGFIFVNSNRGQMMNETLDHRLLDQRDWFFNHSGLTIK